MEQTPTHLPLSFHMDGTPIFERGDFIREGRSLPPNDVALIYDEVMLPEHRHLLPEVKFNMIVIPPSEINSPHTAWLGKSFPDEKRGFIFGRVIQALDPDCRVILQRSSEQGKVTDFIILTMQPLQLAVVPPKYETVLVNTSSDSPARFFEICAREENRDITGLEILQGPGYQIDIEMNLKPNINYDELPIPRIHPGLESFRFLKRRPLYEMLTSYPKGFDFIDPPNENFFIGAV